MNSNRPSNSYDNTCLWHQFWHILIINKEFVLDTDASDTGIGAVLSQVDDQGNERVIAYGSRLPSKPEQCYCVTSRELLAVIFLLISSDYSYLLGRYFQLRSDHGALMNFKEPKGQMAWEVTGIWFPDNSPVWKEAYQCQFTFKTTLQAMWLPDRSCMHVAVVSLQLVWICIAKLQEEYDLYF